MRVIHYWPPKRACRMAYRHQMMRNNAIATLPQTYPDPYRRFVKSP